MNLLITLLTSLFLNTPNTPSAKDEGVTSDSKYITVIQKTVELNDDNYHIVLSSKNKKGVRI